jgi:hypothetical protein
LPHLTAARNAASAARVSLLREAPGQTPHAALALPADTRHQKDRGSQPDKGVYLAVDTCGMAKKPEPPKPIIWTIYKITAKAVRLGTVEAADEAIAIENATAEFRVPASKLMAVRRRRAAIPQRSQAQMAPSCSAPERKSAGPG